MRLLFDHNLSRHLVRQLDDIYPGASHVALIGLERASDDDVWRHAHDNNGAADAHRPVTLVSRMVVT